MKLLISGGHPSPALAVIDTLQANYPEIEVAFVGRLIAQHSTGQAAGEQQEVAARGIPFFPLQTAKWEASLRHRLGAIPTLIRASAAAWRIISEVKPDMFLSFGSYVAVPVALACWLHGIPIITHEQTRVAGMSNRVIATWARAVAISYPESASHFPKHKTVVTGLPLRPQLFDPHPARPDWVSDAFATSPKPLLYVTGGSTGATAINTCLQQSLPTLLQSWRVIHPCGRATAEHDWLSELRQTRARLASALQADYIVLEHLTAAELAWVYRHATAGFGRSGANTTAEVAAFGIPAVLVPLPLSNFDEQQHNAQALVADGLARVLDQSTLTPETLRSNLDTVRTTDRQPTKTLPSVPPANQLLIKLILTTYRQTHTQS